MSGAYRPPDEAVNVLSSSKNDRPAAHEEAATARTVLLTPMHPTGDSHDSPEKFAFSPSAISDGYRF